MEQHPDKKIVIMEKVEYTKFLNGELVWWFQRIPEKDKNSVRFWDRSPKQPKGD